MELEDAQRAIRTVRADAAKYGMATDHIGMWGFSAGGHLAATAGTQFDAGNAGGGGCDGAGEQPAGFSGAGVSGDHDAGSVRHTGSQKYLLGDAPTQAAKDAMSAELHVTKETPPTFLFATTDDNTVPVMNSVMFYSALVKAGVPAEMHLFQHGRHGAGLAAANPQLSGWPDLLMKWMRERGYAAPVETVLPDGRTARGAVTS